MYSNMLNIIPNSPCHLESPPVSAPIHQPQQTPTGPQLQQKTIDPLQTKKLICDDPIPGSG